MTDRIPLDAPLARRTRRYDSYRRCSCGHIAAHHRQDAAEGGMTACRSCECECFRPRGRQAARPALAFAREYVNNDGLKLIEFRRPDRSRVTVCVRPERLAPVRFTRDEAQALAEVHLTGRCAADCPVIESGGSGHDG